MTDAEAIKFLWTHKTQDHAVLADEDLLIVRGEGVYVWTKSGRKLLDGFAGLAVVNIGHGRKEIAEAMRAQAECLGYYPTTRGFSNRPAAQLAAKLAEITPGDLTYTMFAVSGSEANERAMQVARHYWLRQGYPGKYKVISLHGAYHGATQATYALCGTPEMVEPYKPYIPPGFVKFAAPYPLHDGVDYADPQQLRTAAERLREVISNEDPETVSGVILDPILSAPGFIIPPSGWLKMVQSVCQEMNVLFVADEVIAGFGRTGKWFACQHEPIVPDILTVAKGITSGYIPLSATIVRAGLAEIFPENSTVENVHPNTYAGHPVACAVALENIRIMSEEKLVENSHNMGMRLLAGLESAVGKSPIVGAIRGLGLAVGVDLVEPDGSRRALERNLVEDLNNEAWNRGAIVFARGSVLRLAPPLCITASEVDELVSITAEVILDLERDLPRHVARRHQ